MRRVCKRSEHMGQDTARARGAEGGEITPLLLFHGALTCPSLDDGIN